MTITYEYEDALYVNLTNKCNCACEFCLRKGKAQGSIYTEDSLWLEREPTRQEALDSFLSRDVCAYREIVFCGYGEPTYRLDDLLWLVDRLKEKFGDKLPPVRINTNGHANLIHGRDVCPQLEGRIDTLSISLNAADAASYTALCHPQQGEAAYQAMLDFTRESAQYVPNVVLTIVDKDKTPEEIEMYRKLCGVADTAFTAVSRIARPGVSERDMVNTFRESVIASGVCTPSSWSMFSTGESGSRLTIPGEAVIQKGDVVKFDAGVGAEFDFYLTDTSRSWVMEGADPVLYKLKDRLYEGLQRMIAAAKPGLPICDLYHVAYDYVKEMFPAYVRGHQGHSISMGPATCEAPVINAGTTRPLEAGMILAMEVPCYIPGVQGFNIEDMVLITEDGCEVLTPNTPHYL